MRAPDPDGAGVGSYTPPPVLGHINIGAYDLDPIGANNGDIYYNGTSYALRVYDTATSSWISVPGVKSGAGAPSTTPSYIGQYYFDTTNTILYVSINTTASTDWKKVFIGSIAESDVTNLVTDLAAKAPTSSPTFTGTVTSNGALTVSPSAGTAALQVNPPAGTLGIQIKAGDTATAVFKLRNTTDTADLYAISDSGKIVTGSGGGIGSPNAQVSVNAASSAVGIAVKLGASGSSDLQQWLANNGTTVLAKVDSAGGFTSASTFTTSNFNARLGESSNTGYVRLQRGTAALTNPGANLGLLYFRDGTVSGTLKLVTRAGTAGAETTILDNIDTANGVVNTVTLPEIIKANGNQSATFAIDAGAGTTHTVTLTGSIGTALTFSNLPSDGSITLTLIITQDATGSRTITWPSGTKWAGGTAPTLSTAANAVDIVTLVVNRSAGSTSAVYGFLSGKAFA